MRAYELIIVARADLDENALTELVNKVSDWITTGGGQVEKIDVWGKRKLAYPIRKQLEGIYYLMNVNLPSKLGSTLERNLKLSEQVLRYSLIVKD